MVLPSPASVAGSIVSGGRGEKNTKENAANTMTITAMVTRAKNFNMCLGLAVPKKQSYQIADINV